MHIEFCLRTNPSWHGLCLSCTAICFRDVVVLLIASAAILKYGVDGIVGSAGTVQSVSRCLLVATTSSPFFLDGMKRLQRWKHLSSESNPSCLRRRRKRGNYVVPSLHVRPRRRLIFDMSETTWRMYSWKQLMNQVIRRLSKLFVSLLVPR